jgi:UDP-N-acetylglucosamine 3-dehydrogenase
MRVGAVGAGRHASANLLPNLTFAGLELIAVCTGHETSAKEAAKRLGVAHAFTDVSDMIESVELDGVVVSVPPAEYAEILRVCIAAGKPAYCEKPGASSAAEGLELAQLASATGVPIVVGYMKRFAPSYRRVREIARSEAFGGTTIGSFTFVMGKWGNDDARDYIMDNPVHHLDLARYLVGEATHVEVLASVLPGLGIAFAVVAKMAEAVCTFNFSTTGSWYQQNERIELFGRGQSVAVENVDTCVYRPQEQPAQVWRPNYTVPADWNHTQTTMGFIPALEHFRDVVVNDAANLSDLESAAHTLALAEQIAAVAGV